LSRERTVAPGIVVERVHAPNDEVRSLVAELEAELAANYPPEQRHGLSLDAIFQPHIRFFTARAGARPAGCGGVAIFGDFAELKRMYVRPPFRGRGVADALLVRMVDETRAAGRSLLRLETGVAQHAAIRFYERHGFLRCGAFEPYASMPARSLSTSVFMERLLARTPGERA
jgi:putative acetyltransferase